MKKVFFLLLLPLFLYSNIRVSVTYPFEAFFVKKIAQKYVDIDSISNIYTEEQTILLYTKRHRLAKNKVYFHFNLQLEKKYSKILKKTNDKLLVVDMSKGINKLQYKNKENPYIWMDPLLVRAVAKNIYEALIEVDPRRSAYYKTNYNRFLNELDSTFIRIKEKLYKNEIYNLYIYDEHWAYFMRRFDINTFRIEKKYLHANKIKEVKALTEKNDIKAILISPNDTYSIAKSVATTVNIKINENDIFSEVWSLNILRLTNEFSK